MKNIAKLAHLSWRYLWSRPLAAVLNLLLLTLGLAAITLALLMVTQLDKGFGRDPTGIDLVVGADVLRALGGVLLAVAALSVFIALWNAVRERRTDLAMLRMLGAPPGRVAGLVLWEALWLAALASMLGLLLGHGLAHGLGWALQAQGLPPVTGWIWLPAEAGVPLLAAGVAALAALLPAMQAYRTDVADLLGQP